MSYFKTLSTIRVPLWVMRTAGQWQKYLSQFLQLREHLLNQWFPHLEYGDALELNGQFRTNVTCHVLLQFYKNGNKQLPAWSYSNWVCISKPSDDSIFVAKDSEKKTHAFDFGQCMWAGTVKGKKKIGKANRPWRLIGLWEVETHTFSLDSRLTDGGKVVSLNRRPSFTAQEDCWYSFLLEGDSTSGRMEGLIKLKKSTSSGLEPATFRLRYRVPLAGIVQLLKLNFRCR
jgi:hypothetical protein